MATDNSNSDSVSTQLAAYQQREAELKLKSALDGLAKGTAQQLGHLVESVEGDVKGAIENLTGTMVDGIRDLKAELDVAEAVRRNPWGWVAGAAAAGAAAALIIRNQPRRLNWFILAAEVGMTVMQAKNAAQQRVTASPL